MDWELSTWWPCFRSDWRSWQVAETEEEGPSCLFRLRQDGNVPSRTTTEDCCNIFLPYLGKFLPPKNTRLKRSKLNEKLLTWQIGFAAAWQWYTYYYYMEVNSILWNWFDSHERRNFREGGIVCKMWSSQGYNNIYKRNKFPGSSKNTWLGRSSTSNLF